MKKHFNSIFKFAVFLGDIFLVYLSFVICYNIRFFSRWFTNIFPITKGIPEWNLYQEFLYLCVFLWSFVFIFNKFYKNLFLSALDEFLLVIKNITIAFVFTVFLTFIYHFQYQFSRLVLLLSWIISIVLIFIYHEAMKYIYQNLRKSLIGNYDVIIISKTKDVNFIKKLIKKHRYIKPYYLLKENFLSRVYELIKRKNIQEIFIPSAFLISHQEELLDLADECEIRHIDLKIIPDIFQLRQGEILIDESLSLPIFHIKPLSLYGYNYYFKRIFDVVLSILILSFLFIPLFFISLLIKLDSEGPVIYSHSRKGFKGKIFMFYKFRTMVKNADVLLEKIKSLSERQGPVFKMRNDPRVTRVGKFLRKFSIDEIPQLINVLKGDMSLVGPRPQVLWETEAYDRIAKRRLNVVPGITGLWQISGRAILSFDDMIKLDVYYIENWTPGLDIKILLKTLSAIFSQKGAY